jgi:hypothetical protein
VVDAREKIVGRPSVDGGHPAQQTIRLTKNHHHDAIARIACVNPVAHP